MAWQPTLPPQYSSVFGNGASCDLCETINSSLHYNLAGWKTALTRGWLRGSWQSLWRRGKRRATRVGANKANKASTSFGKGTLPTPPAGDQYSSSWWNREWRWIWAGSSISEEKSKGPRCHETWCCVLWLKNQCCWLSTQCRGKRGWR